MKNEKILIFGDSYSTFRGYIPEGYAAYYPMVTEKMDVDTVEATWWYQVAKESDSEIVLNNSWSGSTVCNTGYNGDCSTTSSFICRLNRLIDEGFFAKNAIDRVLVLGGTNDSWTENAAGSLQYSDFTAEDLRLVLPGICYFAERLLSVVPKEKILFIVNTPLRSEIVDGMVELCRHYEIPCVKLEGIDKAGGHPTKLGMKQIKEQVLASLS